MVSTIPYYSFKGLNFRRRQPFWILIAGIIVIQLTVAAPQVMLFTIFSLYALSGPVRLLLRQVRPTPRTTSDAPLVTEVASLPHGLDTDEKSRL